MAYAKASWHDLSRKVTIRIGASTYHEVIPSEIRITPVPYTGDSVTIETNINGQRVSTFSTKAFHLDVELIWNETGPYNYAALCAVADALVTNVGTATAIYFSPYDSTDTTNRDASIFEVIPEIADDMLEMVYTGRVRERRVRFVLRAKNTVSAIPDWMKF